MHLNGVVIFAAACLTHTAILASATSLRFDDSRHEVTTPSSHLEVVDSCYLYIQKVEDQEALLDQLATIFDDLRVPDIRNWFRDEIKMVGHILELPVLRGHEHRYAPLLKRFSLPKKRQVRLREDDDVDTITTEMVSPVLKSPLTPKTTESREHNESAEVIAPSDASNYNVDPTPQVQVKKGPLEDVGLPEWFINDPNYNQPRYSVIDLYLNFRPMAMLMGFNNDHDCKEHAPYESAPNVDLQQWIKSLHKLDTDHTRAN